MVFTFGMTPSHVCNCVMCREEPGPWTLLSYQEIREWFRYKRRQFKTPGPSYGPDELKLCLTNTHRTRRVSVLFSPSVMLPFAFDQPMNLRI